MNIELTDAEVREAVLAYCYVNKIVSTEQVVDTDPKLINFTHNASTQTITASITINNNPNDKRI